ncbi:MAG: hypothetical protein Pg6C_02830 [Treponemataceae bacterium]|nr:MAG: hypothetical protein Pg6C_02830 [Treponemataceae bacterium]
MTDEIWELSKPKLKKRRPTSEITVWTVWLEKEYNYKMSAGTIYIHFHMKGENERWA